MGAATAEVRALNLSTMALVLLSSTALAGCRSANPEHSIDMAAPLDLAMPIDLAMGREAPDLHIRDASAPQDLLTLASGRLRLVTGNLTTGNNQSYEQPGIRIFRGLAADVALVQELNVAGNSSGDLRAFVDQAFGSEYVYTRAQVSGQIPNGIVSRYPIIASGEWTDNQVGDRDFVWAQIDVPGPIDLYAISVHLLSTNASARDLEANELAQHIAGLPSDAYVVLGGDFNTGTRSEACVQTLSSVLVTSGPFPVDQASLDNTNANRNKPYDWVLVNSSLEARAMTVAIGSSRFEHGFVADTRVYAPISDLAPALASDSGAPSMQHMAVVRDFALPGAGPPGD